MLRLILYALQQWVIGEMCYSYRKFLFFILKMPLLTIHDLELMTPLFSGRAGHALAHSIMKALSIDRANELYDHNAHLIGADFAHSVLSELEVTYTILGNRNIQLPEPPYITISNHPYGSIDGIILADLFGHYTPSYKIMANRILQRIKAMTPSFITVTPTGAERTTPTAESIIGIRRALQHLHDGGALGLFPAGAVSNLDLRHRCISDRTWQPAIIRLIAQAHVPIVPVHFIDGNSYLYYILGLIDWRIRLLRLPAELFNKQHCPTRLYIGTPISTNEQLQYLTTHTIEEFGQWLRHMVYTAKE